ncbi:FAD-binding oxidoreductase [Pseudoponticoccus marisrubri]|uniref:FAD-dependent oxidoreductase n=1 Tax=Pseudoponticoccus marisrubri TaxID=1685382 RepID=A0A0W7WFS6_9RHOB|nr:FAD-binding oxidoreductase [Pseudoponticoccus marisrubri]KUF09326.1 FAD-dependent oxidoreductase [Pseudoponticoccus marisrubri]
MSLLDDLRGAIGAGHVLTGEDCAAWSRDWTGQYSWTPLCVARPADTGEVSAVLRLAHAARCPVVPVSGMTGLTGGASAEGAVMLSLDRMTAIREIRAPARLAVVEAGVVLEQLHAAAAEQGLAFPMTFGAKGSARIGGMLATNAGGSNVLRHGNTRDLVLGVEAVLADGRVVDLMSELHKNNAGYDLRHLLIGSEGTLGVITAAVLKLVPRPRAHATAMVATATLTEALALLNRLQDMTGGAVEAFEYMPGAYMRRYATLHPEVQLPLGQDHAVNLLVELGATAPRDATPDETGAVPIVSYLEEVLADLLEEGAVQDAVVAQTDAQRRAFWALRESAAEVTLSRKPVLLNDVAVPVDRVGAFLERAEAAIRAVDPGAESTAVSHLGDGNIHFGVWPSEAGIARKEALTEAVEDVVSEMRGSFSAEHGIGLSKLGSMARRKDPVALEMMRAVKSALDPRDILNPGKLVP